MKNLILTAIIFISTLSISKANSASDFELQLVEKVKSFVMVDKVIEALHLNKTANVWITINEDKTIHIENVESGDFLTSFYIKKSLEGKSVDANDELIGKTIVVELDFLKSK